MIDELVLSDEQSEAIVQKAMDFQVYTDDMPDTPKGRLEAAHEIVAFTIDSWQQENPNPESDAGKDMLAMFKIAGIRAGTGGEIEYTNIAASNGDKSEKAVDTTETAFDIDSYIEGYSELTPATRIKKIKAKELDPDDDDDYNTLVSIAEWEESQEQPSARVLDYLNEIIPPAEEEGIDHQAETPEPEEEAGTTAELWTDETLSALERDELKEVAKGFEVEFPQRLTGPGKRKVVNAILEAQAGEPEPEAAAPASDEPMDEPWEGYNEASEDDIIAVINNIDEYVDGDPIEALEYVLAYERSMETPSEILIEMLKIVIPPAEGAAQPEPVKDEPKPAKADKPKQSKSGSNLGHLTDAAIKSSEHSAALRKAGLGAPLDFDGDMPELPTDIAAVDHSQLSNLMHAFQDALSTSTWQASMAYIEADMYEEIADYLENRALLASDQTNDTKRKAEARTDEEYLKYRGLYKQRYHDYVRFRDLAKTLEGRVKVLSRTGGFKEDDNEASDRSATPRLRRRAA